MKLKLKLKLTIASTIGCLLNNAHAHCTALQALATAIAQEAHQENLVKTFSSVAIRYQVPIVFRAPSVPSQSLIQNGFDTKPQKIKNKTSVMPGLEGLIPCDSRSGKIGDKLRALLRNPNQSSPEIQKRKQQITILLAHEQQMVEERLSERDTEGRPVYTSTMIRRVVRNSPEVLVYTDETASATQWVKEYQGFDHPHPVKVLATHENKLPITADVDLFLIGQPKGKPNPVTYDKEAGFSTAFGKSVAHDLNSEWKKITQNSNTLVQHGEEAHFGLNPIDDEIVAVSASGKISHFDLKSSNSNRSQELIKMGKWLKREGTKADIAMPTEDIQKSRQTYLKEQVGLDLDYSEARKDYQILENVIGSHSLSN